MISLSFPVCTVRKGRGGPAKSLRFLLLIGIIPLLVSCASVLEVAQASQEPPSVERVLDRVNTAARAIELEDILLRAMPISAASTWPGDLDRPIPNGDQNKLGTIVQQDFLYEPRSGFLPSAVRIKVMYVQTILFDECPNLYYQRKFLDTPPSNDAIRIYGAKVLGPDYSPVFNKSFYRFLRFTPDFRPKKSHFEGKMAEQSVEFFPSLEEAVISLADNADQLRKIRDDMMELDERKKRAVRNIDENAGTIKKLKDQGEARNRNEIASQEEEMKVHKKEYDDAARSYGELLKGWKSELSKVKRQTTAFNAEQRLLARNIQSALNASKEMYDDSVVLIGIALAKLPASLSNIDEEIKYLLRSHHGGERIARIVQNSVSLFDNAVIIRSELGQLHEEASAMDGLFDSRIKTTTVNK